MDLKEGDIVILKSGGPQMTISAIDDFMGEGHGALCVWFEKNQPKEKVFKLHVLEKVDE